MATARTARRMSARVECTGFWAATRICAKGFFAVAAAFAEAAASTGVVRLSVGAGTGGGGGLLHAQDDGTWAGWPQVSPSAWSGSATPTHRRARSGTREVSARFRLMLEHQTAKA